jgi:heme-binding protein
MVSGRGRLIRHAALILIAGACAIQLVRPARTNPPTDPARTLMAVTHSPAGVNTVLERGCRDCHSHDTRWPWYSSVAPVSWFVINDVNSGRRHFNYSDWARYDRDKIPQLLKDICDQTRKGEMPLSIYLWMHPDSRLSDRDVSLLCDWSDAERRSFRQKAEGN